MYPGVYAKKFAYSIPQNGIYGSEVRKISHKQKRQIVFHSASINLD